MSGLRRSLPLACVNQLWWRVFSQLYRVEGLGRTPYLCYGCPSWQWGRPLL